MACAASKMELPNNDGNIILWAEPTIFFGVSYKPIEIIFFFLSYTQRKKNRRPPL